MGGGSSDDRNTVFPSPPAQVLNGRAEESDAGHPSALPLAADDNEAVSSQRRTILPPKSTPGAPSARWRASTQRVIQLKRSTTHFVNAKVRIVTSEAPGISVSDQRTLSEYFAT